MENNEEVIQILNLESTEEITSWLRVNYYDFQDFEPSEELLQHSFLPIIVLNGAGLVGIIIQKNGELILTQKKSDIRMNDFDLNEVSCFRLIEKNIFMHLGYEEIAHTQYNQLPNPQIFISIASYRDSELKHTLYDLYKKAKYPDAIRTFCLNQYSKDDVFNLEHNDPYLRQFNIEFGEVEYQKSRGVCWARNYCQLQYNNEPYFLQIDSHMRFTENWDTELINSLEQIQDPKGIISCYPPEYNPKDEQLIPSIVYSKPVSFADNHSLIIKGIPVVDQDDYQINCRHQWVSAGFLFTYGKFCSEVPYDPWHYFQGEETDLTLRAYTRDWNIYAPDKCLIWHYYHREGENDRTRHWEDNPEWVRLKKLSDERMMFKLQLSSFDARKESLLFVDKFRLGDNRNIDDFENELSVNFQQKLIN